MTPYNPWVFNLKKSAGVAGIVIASSYLGASAQPLTKEESDVPSLDTGTGLLLKEPATKKALTPEDEFSELVSLQRSSPSSKAILNEGSNDLIGKTLLTLPPDIVEEIEKEAVDLIEWKIREQQLSQLDAEIAKQEKTLRVLQVLGISTLLLLIREFYKFLRDGSREGEAP